jgi:hypothetical protein
MKYFWALLLAFTLGTTIVAAQGQQGGIAIRFNIDTAYGNKQPMISWVMKGSPAEKAGLRPGHYIFFINDFDCHDKTAEQISNSIRGDVNSVLTVKYSGSAYANEFQLKECQVVRKKVNKNAAGDVTLCMEGDCDNGKGKLLVNGETYEGTFKEGKYDGDFTIIRANGKTEQKKGVNGEWLLQGKQRIENEFGRIEEATYVNGKREGEVTYIFTSGKKLTCTYKDGQLQPSGTVYFENSMMPKLGKYEGEFKLTDENALPHGKGKYTFSDGTTYETEFEDGKNKKNVLITTIDPTGNTKYEKLTADDKLVLTDANGNLPGEKKVEPEKKPELADVKEKDPLIVVETPATVVTKPEPKPRPKKEPKKKPEPKPKEEPLAVEVKTEPVEVVTPEVVEPVSTEPVKSNTDEVSGELYLVDFVNKMTDKLTGDGYTIVKKVKAPYCKSYAQMYLLQAGKNYNVYVFTQTLNMPVVSVDYGLTPEVSCKNLQQGPNRWLSNTSFTTTKEGSMLLNILTGINDCDEMWVLITTN